MKWSFSHHSTFRRCQRQWFLKCVYASSKAKDPLRKEAYRLSKLVNLLSWRGKLVDSVIGDVVVAGLVQGRRVSIDEARQAALHAFQLGQKSALATDAGTTASPSSGLCFREIEYGAPLSDEDFARVREEIELAIGSFFGSTEVWHYLGSSRKCLAQRPLAWHLDGVTIVAVPDLVVFLDDAPPVIIDWKVQRNPIRDSWLQLAVYAVALTACRPHVDWPPGGAGTDPSAIRLVEAQLLTNEMRLHSTSKEETEDLVDLISKSAMEMNHALGSGDRKLLAPCDFPAARNPTTCQMCNFIRLCWKEVP